MLNPRRASAPTYRTTGVLFAYTEFPRPGRGVAATRLHGISTWQPRRRRDLSPRNIHVAAAASPRPVSTKYPRGSRGVAATRLHCITSQVRRLRGRLTPRVGALRRRRGVLQVLAGAARRPERREPEAPRHAPEELGKDQGPFNFHPNTKFRSAALAGRARGRDPDLDHGRSWL